MNTSFAEIPEEYKIKELIHQKSYLVSGDLKTWEGETTEVFSTISSIIASIIYFSI